MRAFWLAAASAAVLGACGNSADDVPDADAPEAPVEAAAEAPAGLDGAIAGAWRTEAEKARDAWRHPKETLEFFDVAADEAVAEIWPGGGWYTKILAPYLKEGGGTFVAVGLDPARNERAADAAARFEEAYVDKPEIYGDIVVSAYTSESGPFAEPGSLDTVLTFRNTHSWMGGGHADKFFRDAFAALKPGGVLGVVQHRLPSNAQQDPSASTGYVHEDYVRTLATEAGFVFDGSSEINANPADTADHPFGVWTLPPVSRTEDRDGNAPEDFDPAKYEAIGESDRMTLKFIKPAE